MTAREHKDAGNAAGFGVSTRYAGSPLRFDPSDDTPNPAAWKLIMAGSGLPALTDRLLTAKFSGDSGAWLTSIQPAGNYRFSRAQNQSEYTLFLPSDCPTNQDHLTLPVSDASQRELHAKSHWSRIVDPRGVQFLINRRVAYINFN